MKQAEFALRIGGLTVLCANWARDAMDDAEFDPESEVAPEVVERFAQKIKERVDWISQAASPKEAPCDGE